MPDTEFTARLEQLQRHNQQLKRLTLFCMIAVSILLAVPVFAQKAHYGHDGPAVLPDSKDKPR